MSLGSLAEAEAPGVIVVEVAPPCAHAADVERKRLLDCKQRAGVIVVDLHVDEGGDGEAFAPLAVAAPAEALDERVAVHVSTLGHHEERKQSVGNLAGQPESRRRDRAGIDRQRLAGMDDALQRLSEPASVRAAVGERIVHALVDHRLLSRNDLADDRDVFAQALVGFAVGNPVPALDHLRPRRPDTEDETPAGERLKGHGRHRGASGRSRRHLHERGADRHAFRLGQDPGGRRHRVGAIGLRSPDGLVAERFSLLDQVDVDGEVPARIAEHKPELQHCSSPIAGAAAMPPAGWGDRPVLLGLPER